MKGHREGCECFLCRHFGDVPELLAQAERIVEESKRDTKITIIDEVIDAEKFRELLKPIKRGERA
jgi:hypothetical protein